MMTRGDIVQVFFDDGRGGTFTYGVVTAAGPRQFHVTWESGRVQRRPQGCYLVTKVPARSLAAARESLIRLGYLSPEKPTGAPPATPKPRGAALIAELQNRGFRLCELVDSGHYLQPQEWSPLDDERAVKLLDYMIATTEAL